MRISIYTSRELQLLTKRLTELPKDVAANIRKYTRTEALPIWQATVHDHAHSQLERQVLGNTARVAVSSQNISLQSARVGRPLTHGLAPKKDYAGVEFGASPQRETVYRGRRGSKTFEVRRHTQRQLRPRKKTGYVVFPAIADAVPRIASLWVQVTMRTTGDAVELRNG